MDNFDFSVNLTDIDPTQVKSDFGLLPDGDYEVECIESTGKPTKAGDGFMWAATFSILDTGKNIYGRRLWHYFNVVNKSAKAQNLARVELKKLLAQKNVDLAKAKPEDLLGVKVMAKVIQKVDPNYGTKNIIQSFIAEDASSVIPF